MFSDHVMNTLPEDKTEAALELCQVFLSEDKKIPPHVAPSQYEHYLRALNSFRAYCDPYQLEYSFPTLSKNPAEDVQRVRNFFIEVMKIVEKKIGLVMKQV